MTDSGPAGAPDTARRWPRMVAAAFVGFLLLLWSYALFGPRSDPPGTMDDPGFGLEAEPVCAAVAEELLELPPAHETRLADERADIIDRANDLLADQTRRLRALAPIGGEDGRRAGAWLDDWEVYLEDRRTYAAALRTDEDARLLETARGGDHISEALTFFAQINDMPSCAPPGDVA